MNNNLISISEEAIAERQSKNKKKALRNGVISGVLILVFLNFFYRSTFGGLLCFIGVCLLFDLLVLTPFSYDKVKLSLIKEEEEKLKKIEEQKILAEKKLQDQKESGSKLNFTQYSFDKFDNVKCIYTTRYYTFKSSGVFGTSHDGINQSICLHDHEFEMPSVRIKMHLGLYASVLMLEKDNIKKYFIEFVFKSNDLTKDKSREGAPTAEDCKLELLHQNTKAVFHPIFIENKITETKRDLLYADLKTFQNFRFEIDIDTLKSMRTQGFEMRFTDFKNMKIGGNNMWEFSNSMTSSLKELINGFLQDLE
jgi:hypothetical protein